VTLTWTAMFAARDPRDQAASWIKANIPEGARIGVLELPWFYSPPLSRNLGSGVLSSRMRAIDSTAYKLVLLYPGLDILPPEWLIFSNYETEDALRLSGNPSAYEPWGPTIESKLRWLRAAEHDYTTQAVFGAPAAIPGMPHPPHDMRYVRPEIRIYERKK
jgi:hypothetical protein